MKKKSIVICGYPKSGTTWLSRLIAELVDCPFQGNLGFSSGIPLEGSGRSSAFDCYKSHHTLASLVSDRLRDCFKIVYIVRDPRDIAISAAHHFRVNLLSVRRKGNRIIAAANAYLSRAIPYAVRRNRMVDAVLYGDASLSPWLAIPWRDHYHEFRRSDTLIVKYENLLGAPLMTCVDMLSYLGVARSEEEIVNAISNQSFQEKKTFFKAQGKKAEYAFLRRGSSGYWRQELSRQHKQLFVDEVGEELEALSYPLG